MPVAVRMMGGLPGAPWQAPALTGGAQGINSVGAPSLVMALSRGKDGVVAPVTDALAPVLTIVLSLVVHQTVPTTGPTVGIVLTLGGSTSTLYADEEREERPERPEPSPVGP
ncbi:hypothetical protein J2X68_001115 [Streptomyces sp. 3330]|uniref:hypothetical protein n=1 Tax=Streptomyces sp. 3330 TaxID=2817755 RepID=UPI0028626A6C|nr:hypothetical protein [Streptomyces sp. 3330]MDR6974437.1 hypothetical protein [Streptomyces sp. 3330]